MNARSLLLCAALAAAPTSPLRAAEAPADRDARLVEADGEVTVYTAESPEGAPAEEGMPLTAGDRVATGPDGGAEIGFEDGHLFTLKPNSDLTLAKTGRTATEFKLTLGALLAKVQALFAGETLLVRTPTAVAAVRGTEFGVEIEGDETAIGVFEEGKVEVSGDGGREALGPNQETSVRKGKGPLKAGELRRLLRHRRLIKAMVKRALKMRKRWKSLSPEKRRELRKKLIERMRERRERLRERIERRGERRGERPGRRRPGRAPRAPRPGQP